MADRAGRRIAADAAKSGGSGLHEKAKLSGAGLLLARLAQQQERQPRLSRFQMQPPAFRQPELRGIAAHFQHDRRKGFRLQRGFSHPQRFLDPARMSGDEAGRRNAEADEAGGMGKACLAPRLPLGNPEDWPLRPQPFLNERGQRQRKAGGRACIYGECRPQFAKPGDRQPAFQPGIEGLDPQRQPPRRLVAGGRLFQLAGMLAPFFNRGDDLTQGMQVRLRQSGIGHGVHSKLFLLCSYGFQSFTQESTGHF